MMRPASLVAACPHDITAVVYTRGYEYIVCQDDRCIHEALETVETVAGRRAYLRYLPPKPELPTDNPNTFSLVLLLTRGFVILGAVALLWLSLVIGLILAVTHLVR